MAHYVLSDVHGEAARFHGMLEKIHFSKEDTLYVLGDVIDRGPDGIPLLREIMDTPNMVMLLGNHEYMCLQYHSPEATIKDVQRWGRNGNEPTLQGLGQLSLAERHDLLSYLKGLPVHLKVSVGGRNFYLVHGFPGGNVHDEVWGRPGADTPNPLPDFQLIIGHTPVLCFAGTEEEQDAYGRKLAEMREHLRIFHAPGFIDIDCGCGHRLSVKALACLRLEDLEEFYI